MKIPEIVKRIRHSLGLQKELSNEAVVGILRVLDDLPDEEISCGDLYIKLDEYVQREVDKKDAAYLMPVIREHLDVCPECCEEYEALLDVLNKSSENY
ncbi:MAG TPA: hypothetical protein VJ785_10025 [Anaerolineales bacterium]|nr:hypothetical protein [Anaerolineales bacterium]